MTYDVISYLQGSGGSWIPAGRRILSISARTVAIETLQRGTSAAFCRRRCELTRPVKVEGELCGAVFGALLNRDWAGPNFRRL